MREPKDFSQSPMWMRHRNTLDPGVKMAAMQEGLPVPDPALVRALEQAFPPRCRDVTESERHHDRYAGMVDLVAILRQRLDEAEEAERLNPIKQEIETHVHVQGTESAEYGTSGPGSASVSSPRGAGNRRSP